MVASAGTALAAVALSPDADAPLHRQLYDALRGAVLSGHLAPGARLASTRAMAVELGVSRNTVMAAFDQLLAEGYLEGRTGAGTYVTRTLPDDALRARRTPPLPTSKSRRGRGVSKRGAALMANPVTQTRTGAARAFRPGMPAFDAFPLEEWARYVSRRWRAPAPELLGYGDAAGYGPLRQAIAQHLAVARGVRCDAGQVVIVAGSQQALDLAARVLLDPGDAVWMEDPGYQGARAAFAAAGTRIVPVPVDGEGLDVAAGVAREANAAMVYVSPSHQYPLGVTMSLSRRLALLEWARTAGAWVMEDDYDSEYRYAGRPLAALQGLDGDGRVIYLGTFSKVMLPSLRLGYLVLPPDLVDAFVAARAVADRHSPSVEQAALADFIEDGQLERHIRRMRMLYAERQAVLIDAVKRELAGVLELAPSPAGMHLPGWLVDGVDDRAASALAAEHGVEAPAISQYYAGAAARPGVVLGYAATPAKESRAAVRRLAAAWKGMR
jgi:GntR family transcriptional regulator/MocR family aminotransferase